MEQPEFSEKSLTRAVTKIVDSLHHIYNGIQIKPIPPYEDEDFAIEVRIPGAISKDEVLDRTDPGRPQSDTQQNIHPHLYP